MEALGPACCPDTLWDDLELRSALLDKDGAQITELDITELLAGHAQNAVSVVHRLGTIPEEEDAEEDSTAWRSVFDAEGAMVSDEDCRATREVREEEQEVSKGAEEGFWARSLLSDTQREKGIKGEKGGKGEEGAAEAERDPRGKRGPGTEGPWDKGAMGRRGTGTEGPQEPLGVSLRVVREVEEEKVLTVAEVDDRGVPMVPGAVREEREKDEEVTRRHTGAGAAREEKGEEKSKWRTVAGMAWEVGPREAKEDSSNSVEGSRTLSAPGARRAHPGSVDLSSALLHPTDLHLPATAVCC